MKKPDKPLPPGWKRYRIILPQMFSEVSAPDTATALTMGVLSIRNSLDPADKAIMKFAVVEELERCQPPSPPAIS